MSTREHTPGPWAVRPPAWGVLEPYSICRHAEPVARTVPHSRGSEDANARLIALAPEMLEALSSMVVACDLRQGQPIAEDEFPQYHAAVALIRRARGEEAQS